MKNLYPALLALLSFGLAASAQTTAFTYQGNLTDASAPATGNYDMRFTLHDTAAQTNQVGNAANLAPVTVSNGLFTVTLNFGSAVFDGSARWLQVAVRSFGDTNARVELRPRQLVTSTPYAIRSISAVSAITATSATILSAPLPGTNVSGTIPLTNLPPNIALLNSNANFLGSVTATQFNGSGAGLFNVPATGLTGTLPDARLSPNVALLNTNANFNGTVTATNFSGYGGGLTQVPGRLFDNIPRGSAIQALPNTGYLATNNTAAVVVTLPLSINMRVGETVRVSGSGAGGWIIAQNAGQSILVANLLDGIVNWTARDIGRTWRGVASSTDGSKLVAGVTGGQIFTSVNAGVTWGGHNPSANWISVASSGDGTKLVAAANVGNVYTSTDSGANWTPRSSIGSRAWTAVASSLDGTHLAASYGGSGQVYVSTDSGANWTPRGPLLNWTGVALSANGLNLVATASGAQIYGGASWTANGPIQAWTSVASSYDGSKLVAAVNNGQIYVSFDYGVNWAPTGPTDSWMAVSSSADGARLVAVSYSGSIYASLDSGTTWSQISGPPSGLAWTGVAISGDGSVAAAVASGTRKIYVSSQTTTTPGTAGYLTGTRQSAIDLIYIGNNQFMPVTRIGTIRAH